MFKLKSSIPNENGIVHTYFEVVRVKNGIAQCRLKSTRDRLMLEGFREIKEDTETEGETKTRQKKKAKK